MRSFRQFLHHKLATVPERATGRTWTLAGMSDAMTACDLSRRVAPSIVSIVGSNGKGSCGYLLSKSLENAGKKVAFISSPHVHDFRERLVVNGKILPETTWDECFLKLKDHMMHLSYYESIMLVSFCIAFHQSVDVLVLEAGLGGRYDAINVLAADALLVTGVSLEHTEYLGNTKEAIFFEKIQVARAETDLFAADIDREWIERAQQDIGFVNQKIEPLAVPSIPGVSPVLVGLVANVLVKHFSIGHSHIMPSGIPFRAEVIGEGPVIMDTAHNVPAAQYLMHRLVKDFGHQKWDIYCNQKSDRALMPFLEALRPWVSRGYICMAEGLTQEQVLPGHLSDWSWVPATVLKKDMPRRPTVIMGSFFLLQYVGRKLAHF